MKNYYKLLTYEFMNLFKAILFLCFGLIITQNILIGFAMNDRFNIYERFEVIYASSGAVMIFRIFFALLCGLYLKNIYANYWRSKSIYTLMTIPGDRKALYFSKISAFFICFLMLYATELISVLLSYANVRSVIAEIDDGKYLMNNAFFLGVVRSSFLRIILPLGLEGIVSSISIIITIICGLYYGALCERSKKYLGLGVIGIGIFIMIIVLNYRINLHQHYFDYKNLYVYSGVLFLLSGFFMWHSIYLIKKRDIV